MYKLKSALPPLGKQFGKSDLDRIGKDEFLVDQWKFSISYRHLCVLLFQGYFHEPPVSPFDKYKGVPVKFREGIDKGRQMIAGPPLKLFEEKFMRIFEGEALYDPFRKVPKKEVIVWMT